MNKCVFVGVSAVQLSFSVCVQKSKSVLFSHMTHSRISGLNENFVITESLLILFMQCLLNILGYCHRQTGIKGSAPT